MQHSFSVINVPPFQISDEFSMNGPLLSHAILDNTPTVFCNECRPRSDFTKVIKHQTTSFQIEIECRLQNTSGSNSWNCPCRTGKKIVAKR